MKNNTQNGTLPSANTATCMLCGTGSSSRHISNNTVFGSPFGISLCEDCELYYFSTLPDSAFLDEYYGTEYFSDMRESGLRYRLKSLFSAMRARSQFNYIRNHTGDAAGKRVLEIGSADGTFLSFFKAAGCDVRGLETSQYMTEKARKKFGIELEHLDIKDIDPENGRYDIIALPHVIEHLTDPVGILSHCRTLLAPDGIVFIEVPYSPLPKEAAGNELAEYLETTHLYNFRPSSLAKLTERGGLVHKSSGRFFYPVPVMFRSSGKWVGQSLMRGSLAGLNPRRTVPLAAVVFGMIAKYRFKKDPMDTLPPDAPWQGLGDNTRIIAG